MRYYGVMHSLADGRPYIEAEATDPLILEDKYDAVERLEVERDPELRKALNVWDRKDDSLAAIEHASYVISTYGHDIVSGADETREAVDLAHDVDHPWCEALKKARPHLREAAKIIEDVLIDVQDKLAQEPKHRSTGQARRRRVGVGDRLRPPSRRVRL